MKKLSLSLLILLTAVLIVSPSSRTMAAGSTVSPAFVKMKVSTGQKVDTTSIFVKNNDPTTISYETSFVDVDVDTGTLIPLDAKTQQATKVLSVNVSNFTLKPEQSINLIIKATDSGNLSPGGHYAAMVLKQKATTPVPKNVPIQPIISIGVFLVKEDGAVRNITFDDIGKKSLWMSVPKNETFLVSNTGNVDVVPAGFVAIQKGTRTLGKVAFNVESRPLFPNKTQEFTAEWSQLTLRWPGKYQRVISYRYIGSAEATIIRNTIWFVPTWFIVLVLMGVIGLLLVIKKQLGRKKAPTKVDEPIAEQQVQESQKVAKKSTKSKTKKPKNSKK